MGPDPDTRLRDRASVGRSLLCAAHPARDEGDVSNRAAHPWERRRVITSASTARVREEVAARRGSLALVSSRWFLAALADSVLGFFQWERERAAQMRHKDLWFVICGARPAPSTRSNIYVVQLSTRVYYVVEGFFARRQGH